jgi:hypothetical protein
LELNNQIYIYNNLHLHFELLHHQYHHISYSICSTMVSKSKNHNQIITLNQSMMHKFFLPSLQSLYFFILRFSITTKNPIYISFIFHYNNNVLNKFTSHDTQYFIFPMILCQTFQNIFIIINFIIFNAKLKFYYNFKPFLSNLIDLIFV